MFPNGLGMVKRHGPATLCGPEEHGAQNTIPFGWQDQAMGHVQHGKNKRGLHASYFALVYSMQRCGVCETQVNALCPRRSIMS